MWWRSMGVGAFGIEVEGRGDRDGRTGDSDAGAGAAVVGHWSMLSGRWC